MSASHTQRAKLAAPSQAWLYADMAVGAAGGATFLPDLRRDPCCISLLLLLSLFRIMTALHTLITGTARRDQLVTFMWLGHLVWQTLVCLGVGQVPAMATHLVKKGTYGVVMLYLEIVNQASEGRTRKRKAVPGHLASLLSSG
jgi:hypothetical protein